MSISIHALLAESDEYWVGGYGTANNFYPRSPCGERPDDQTTTNNGTTISIHALLAESDPITCCLPMPRAVFLSTLSLRRATAGHDLRCCRPQISIHALLAESDKAAADCFSKPPLFLSTLSLRRATDDQTTTNNGTTISIHALLAESDGASAHAHLPIFDFYPRSPCGERQFRG